MNLENRYAKSETAFERARQVMPGGVNSPVRAYGSVGRDPIVIERGKGCHVTDIDGNEYIDYVAGYGPLILGHAPEQVLAAISKAAKNGAGFGMPTLAETHLANMVINAVPSVELVRFVNSGTEATMSAIRVARSATGKSKVVKFTGCYHGHSDGLLVQAGSGATTIGAPSSPGVPEAITSQTVLLPFNNIDAVATALDQNDDIACIIIEPIAGNMGCIPPKDGYLIGLRELCTRHGVVLIFDEVMTGFRVAYGGAQELFAVVPDLTCLGKIVGGGLPCAAYGGREDLMRLVAPDGATYQAGTLSGNPLAMAAGAATLESLVTGEPYALIEQAAGQLADGLIEGASEFGIDLHCSRVGSMICPFFHKGPVENYEHATACDTGRFTIFFQSMLDRGVVLPPSQYETWFVGTAHDQQAIEQTIRAARESFSIVASS